MVDRELRSRLIQFVRNCFPPLQLFSRSVNLDDAAMSSIIVITNISFFLAKSSMRSSIQLQLHMRVVSPQLSAKAYFPKCVLKLIENVGS